MAWCLMVWGMYCIVSVRLLCQRAESKHAKHCLALHLFFLQILVCPLVSWKASRFLNLFWVKRYFACHIDTNTQMQGILVLLYFIICPTTIETGQLPSWLGRGLLNTPTASLQQGPPPTSVLDMTLNNLMVRFQQCWSFGKCGVPLHCHCSQVHSGPEWLHLIGPYLWVK